MQTTVIKLAIKTAGKDFATQSRLSISILRFTKSAYYVWKKRESACALDFKRKSALMFCACSRDPAGKDLAALCRVTAKPICVLVIDFCLLRAKTAYFLAEKDLALATLTAIIGIAEDILHLHISIHIFHFIIRHTSSP